MTARLEDLKPDALVQGLVGREAVRIVTAEMLGDMACKLVYRGQDGALGEQLVFRTKEPDLELVSGGRKWSFEGNGDLFRLVSEAARIQLAWLFDPYVAVSSSTIDPLPHQISAVYEHMLPRQPMRFLLADDPGAGKTIMAGLLIKELLIRGELERKVHLQGRPFPKPSKIQAANQLFDRAAQLAGHVLEDLPQGADPQGLVGRNREVLLLAIRASAQPHVTACLPRQHVAMPWRRRRSARSWPLTSRGILTGPAVPV
jgi:hypothetical protein